jgi:hypothetical protein
MKTFLILFFAFTTAFAQTHKVEGLLLNSSHKALANVAVFNENTGQHTHTNNFGRFELENVSVNDHLSFTHIGYQTSQISITPEDFNREIRIILEPSETSLSQVLITSEVNILNQIAEIDLETNPVKSSQEILRRVPGLIIGQHAGGGKAEQIFLRGFDIDHGTDITLNVDGMPVNMVSHAHGQGYADLHFLIPETIEKIEFGKGPYYADQGNFNTAGYVGFKTKDRLESNAVSVEYGQFDTFRTVGMFNVLETESSNAYVASSLNLNNGPFESPQNFNRFNLLGKYNFSVPGDQKMTLTASHFQSKWDASGQIPQRAIDNGLISRFGAIDDTEGGNTSRTNLLATHSKYLSETKRIKTKAFYNHYDFELYSNFTFFLEDPVNGDQIKQQEDRNILGLETAVSDFREFGNFNFSYTTGIGFRYDDINEVELSHTRNRKELLNRLAYGNIDETNAYGFLNTEFNFGKFRINPALRLDYFKFDYEDLLSESYDNRSETKVFASPKLNFIYNPTTQFQLFLKTGIGYHSNDTRVVVANKGEDILPAAYGADLGAVFKANDQLIFNAALWTLFLDQEFVYVGDAGIVEPSGKTRRIGLDIGARYQATDWLYLFVDANYTHARSTEDPAGENYIPLAPDFTSTGGIAIENLRNFSGSINYRYLNDRPANEDNSITAEGYVVTDLNLNYSFKNYTFGIIVENLFDTEWNETQFATETRLFDEPAPVEEIHFTPGTPFFLRGKITVHW